MAKPNATTILQHYSLSELLDLIKAKAQQNEVAVLHEARSHVDALTKTIGEQKSTPPVKSREPKPSIKRGRGRPTGKKKYLGDYLVAVLGSKPMKIEEIMEAIKAQGYKSKAKDPRRILYLELKKQVNNKAIKKVGRGMYTGK